MKRFQNPGDFTQKQDTIFEFYEYIWFDCLEVTWKP